MAQHDYVIANGTGAAVRSDINNGLAAIVSQNSGATEPATMYAYQWWADTTTGLLKIRNAANNAWVTVGTLASANLGLLSSGSTVTAALGSASTPGITFTGDLNTGIYSPGADQFGISTGGTSRLTIDASGNINMDSGTVYVDAANNRLGIGTTNPTSALHIDAASGEPLKFRSQTSGSNYFTHVNHAGGDLAYVGAGGGAALNSGTTSDYAIRANQGALLFGTNGNNERGRFDTSGRFLVGTSTSSDYNQFGSAPILQVIEKGGNDSAIGIERADGANASDGTLKFRKTRSSTPGGVTAVASGDGIGSIQFFGTDGTNEIAAASIAAAVDGTPGANDMPGRLVFATTADGASSPTERMRIHQNGYVSFNGTNTTTSNGGVGAVYKFFGADGNVTLPFESTGTNKNVLLEYRRTGRSNARTSQIQIGENPSNQGIVYVYSSAANADISGGVALENGATSWASISDIRLKNIVSTFDSALSNVSTLEAFRFTWKNDASAAPQVGLSAQSVQAVLPEAVSSGKPINASEDDDAEYLSVRYTEVIPLLVAALQESKQRIETLEAKVAALEAA